MQTAHAPPGYSTYLLPPLNIHVYLRDIDKGKLLWVASSSSGHSSLQPSRTAWHGHAWDASSALQRCYINKNDCIQICRNTYSMTHVPLSLPQEISSLYCAREGQSFWTRQFGYRFFMFRSRQVNWFSLILTKEIADLFLLKFLQKTLV